MPPIRLDHCVIHVSDWERSNAFYRDVLGAEVVALGSKWAYRFGDTRSICMALAWNATPVARIPVPPGGSDSVLYLARLDRQRPRRIWRSRVCPIELGPAARVGVCAALGRALFSRPRWLAAGIHCVRRKLGDIGAVSRGEPQ